MNKNLLKGHQVLLRGPEPKDIDFIYRLENDPLIWHYGNTLIPYSRHQIEQYVLSTQHDIYTERQVRLMIETIGEVTERKLVGAIDLFDFEPHHQRAGVGILIMEDERRHGYASESLEMLIAYSFKVLQLHQLFCNITADNLPSIQLFEKAGFKQCGTKIDWRLQGNEWMNELTFQLIQS
jgi:diamine N-acetyltransferase